MQHDLQLNATKCQFLQLAQRPIAFSDRALAQVYYAGVEVV